MLLVMMGKIIFNKNVNQLIKTKESFSACSKGITVTTSAEKINNMHVVCFFPVIIVYAVCFLIFSSKKIYTYHCFDNNLILITVLKQRGHFSDLSVLPRATYCIRTTSFFYFLIASSGTFIEFCNRRTFRTSELINKTIR